MRITYAKATNFLSYKELEYIYTKQGLTLLEGPVGAGKSAFMDVVSYGIFGSISKDVAADEVINRQVGSDLYTEIGFEDDGRICKIIRTRKHSKYGSDVFMEVDGRTVRGKDVKETQKIIEREIGCSFDVFTKATYFSQFSPIDRFLSATDGEKKKLISEVCDLSYYDQLLETVKLDLNAKSKAIDDVVALAKDVESKLDYIKKKQFEIQEQQRLWEIRHNGRLKDVLDTIASYDAIQKTNLSKAINTMETYRSRLKDLQTEQARLSSIVEPDYKSLVDPIDVRLDLIQRIEQAKMEKESKIYVLKEKNRTLMAQIQAEQSKIKSNENSTCPHCYGPIDHSRIQKTIDLYQSQIDQNYTVYAGYQTDIAEMINMITPKASLMSQKADINEQVLKYRAVRSTLIGINNNLVDLNRSIVDQEDKIKSLTTYDNPHRKMYDNLVLEKNPYTAMDPSSEIDDLNKKMSAVKVKLESAQNDYQLVLWWKDALSIYIRSYLMDAFIEQINQKSNVYLNTLFDGVLQLDMSAVTEKGKEVKEKISVTIFNGSDECSYDSLSGGERCRICLAVNLALSDITSQVNSKTFNILMLDEIFTGLDEVGKTQTLKLLKDLEQRFDTIFVIDHAEGFKSMFSNTVSVEKRNGVSVIGKVGV